MLASDRAEVRKILSERLTTLRSSNDKPVSAEETAMIRGRIAECKHMLAEFDPELRTVPDHKAGAY